VFNPRIKLRHLVTFLEVARLRSVVNAAEQLNIAASVNKRQAETWANVVEFGTRRAHSPEAGVLAGPVEAMVSLAPVSSEMALR